MTDLFVKNWSPLTQHYKVSEGLVQSSLQVLQNEADLACNFTHSLIARVYPIDNISCAPSKEISELTSQGSFLIRNGAVRFQSRIHHHLCHSFPFPQQVYERSKPVCDNPRRKCRRSRGHVPMRLLLQRRATRPTNRMHTAN